RGLRAQRSRLIVYSLFATRYLPNRATIRSGGPAITQKPVALGVKPDAARLSWQVSCRSWHCSRVP
ncbi:hypothetical protein, partial [Klebsiella michiganensis]|uniref:hypothetical protein n=1 Tax=Klebsiella michiganensis TaxID=1134687 RepID=UPI0019549E2C